MSRCYSDYDDETGCDEQAEYAAKVNWTAGPMLLCEKHAEVYRADRDVIEIRSLPREKEADTKKRPGQ